MRAKKHHLVLDPSGGELLVDEDNAYAYRSPIEIVECPFCGGGRPDHLGYLIGGGALWECPEPLTLMEELAAVPLED